MLKKTFFILCVLIGSIVFYACQNSDNNILPDENSDTSGKFYQTKKTTVSTLNLIKNNIHFINIQSSFDTLSNQIIHNINTMTTVEKQEMVDNIQVLLDNGGTTSEYLDAMEINSEQFYTSISYMNQQIEDLISEIPQLTDEDLDELLESLLANEDAGTCIGAYIMCKMAANFDRLEDSMKDNGSEDEINGRHLSRLAACTVDYIGCKVGDLF